MGGLEALGTLSMFANRGNRGNKQAFEEEKFTIGKLTELYNNAPTDAARDVVTQHMRSYVNAMSPGGRMILGTYIEAGPLSSDKVKEQAFNKLWGKEPQVTVNANENPELWATQNYGQLRYRANKIKYMTGRDIDVPTMGQFTSNGNSLIWHRRSNGDMQVIPADLESIGSTIQGMSIPALVASGGKVVESVEFRGGDGNGAYEVKKIFNPFENQRYLQITPLKGFTGKDQSIPSEAPKELVNAMIGLDGFERGEEDYLSKEQMASGSRLQQILEINDPQDRAAALNDFKKDYSLGNWNIIEVDKKAIDRGFFGKLFSGPNKRSFTIVPGTKVIKEFPDGSKVVGYRDTTKGRDHMYSMEGLFTHMDLQQWDQALQDQYARAQRQAESNPSGSKPAKKPVKTVSVDEAVESNPDLLKELQPDYGKAYQKSLSIGTSIPINPNFGTGPGSGPAAAAAAMRGSE